MSKIEFRENKVLKLLNILSRPVPMEEIMKQDKQVLMMQNWVKAKGYETQGPLIMYSSGIKGMDGDKPIIDSKIMVQLKNNNVRLELPYKFEPEIRIENCLMARFNDNADKLQFATDRFNDSENFVTEYNRYKFDGGLKQDTRGRIDKNLSNDII